MLTVAEIKSFIDADATSEKKQFARVGQRYRDSEHDILNNRLFYFNTDGNLVEDKTRANIKISHPFFSELAQQLPAYMLSFEENPIRAKEKAEGLQDFLDEYFDDEFWQEVGDLIDGAYSKGFEYIYGYKNDENRMTFMCADSLNVIEVRAKDTDDHCEYVIYWYVDRIEKGTKLIKRIQVWDKEKTHYYVQVDDGNIEVDKTEEINPRPHIVMTDDKTGEKAGLPLGFIPFWKLPNNKKETSGLKPIKPIIDDYDFMVCGLSNNLADFDVPLHFVSGFQGDNLDELQVNLKTKKIVAVPDAEGSIDIKTVDIPYQARLAKAELDEKNIYRFGMGFNSTQVGDGNITNVVIISRYTLLDLKATNMYKRLRKVLKSIIKVVLDEINEANNTDYQFKDIEFKFKPVIPTNETENISNEKIKAETKQIAVNTILNVAAQIGDEKAAQLICEEFDIDYDDIKDEIEKLKEEQKTAAAKAALDAVVTEPIDPTTPEDV